jgi:WD40 repeat protein
MSTQARFLSLILLSLGSSCLAAEPARDRFGDPLPDGAVARLGSFHLRNEQQILTAAYLADGKSLVVCDSNSISFWDLATGKAVQRVPLKHIPAGVRMRRFSADGKTLIQSSSDNILRFVDTTTGAEQRTLNHAQCGLIQALDMSRDGKMLVAIHQASIALWDVANGKLLREFKGAPIVPLAPSKLIALTADGKQVVLPHSDGSLHLVDTSTGKELRAIEMSLRPGSDPSVRVQRLAISPDGRYLAYGGAATPLTVCELATGKRLRELTPTPGILWGLTFTPNGRFVAVDENTKIRLIGVLSGKEIRKLPVPRGMYSTLVFSPDGRTLAATRGSRTINLWDVASDRHPHPIVGHEAAIRSMDFFPDGKHLVSADRTGRMMVWDIASGRDLAGREIKAVALSLAGDGDGDAVRFVGLDAAVHRWELSTGREERQQTLGELSTYWMALSPDGRSIALMYQGVAPQLQLRDLKDNTTVMLQTLPAKGEVTRAAFTPDSRRLATSSTDGSLRLWDRDTGKLVREWKGTPRHQPKHLTFANYGRSLALFDDMVRLREITSGEDRLQIAVPYVLFSMAYSPDGRFLACGQGDGTIVVHGTGSGKQVAQLQGKQGFVRALAFSRDGRLLASGSEDGTILVWKVPDGEDLPATLKAEEALTFWQALSGDDAARANRALAGLAAAPAQAVPLIKERFRVPGKPPSAERMARLIAELDDDSYKVRERATRELAEAGPDTADALRAALANDPSAEKKARLERLLARLSKGVDLERLRCLRALEVLERIGTAEAKDALRGLTEKDIGPTLREEIRASLLRLDASR